MSKKKPAKKKKTAKKKTRQGISKSAPVESLPSLQSMEGLLAGIGGMGRGKRSAVDEAQETMYDAWEAPTRQRAVALARKALEVSPDCADAYNLLAEETAKSLEDAIDLYRKGVEAGERALGKKAFREDVGYFWGILETRPYMRGPAPAWRRPSGRRVSMKRPSSITGSCSGSTPTTTRALGIC